MKKIYLIFVVLLMTFTLFSCIEVVVGNVTEIEVTFTPQVAYHLGDEVTFTGDTVTVSFSDRDPIEFAMNDNRVTITGTGVKYVGETPQLNTDVLGEKTLRVAYDNVSITLQYFVANKIVIKDGSIVSSFMTIQDAIDASSGNETIAVAPGTYDEAVLVNKTNLTLQALGEVTIRNYNSSNPSLVEPLGDRGISVLKEMGTITIKGFTVTGYQNGILQTGANAQGTILHVIGNTVEATYGSIMRNGIQITGNGGSVIGNTVYGAPLTSDWASSAITIYNASNVIVEGNTVLGNPNVGIAIQNGNVDLVTNIIVRNNQISNAEDAFRISGNYNEVTDITFEGNTVVGRAVESGSVWIRGLNIFTVTVDNIKLIDNTFTWRGTLSQSLDVRVAWSAIATNVIIDNTGEEKTALVSRESELRALLSSTGDPTITKVKVANPWYDFNLSSKLVIGRSVIFDGNGNTLKASVDFGTDHLLGIEANNITIENLTLDSDSKAFGLQPYDGFTGISLNNLTVVNSKE